MNVKLHKSIIVFACLIILLRQIYIEIYIDVLLFILLFIVKV